MYSALDLHSPFQKSIFYIIDFHRNWSFWPFQNWPLSDDLDEFAFIDELEQQARFKRSAPSAIEVDHEDDHLHADHEDDECRPRYIGHELDPHISRTLRLICLTVILLMAGLELDPVALMKLSAMVLRATFIPCFVEATAVAGNFC